MIYHSTGLEFERFLDDTRGIRSWDDDEYEGLGIWCSEDKRFCLEFNKICYKKNYCQLLELEIAGSIFDSRKENWVMLEINHFGTKMLFGEILYHYYMISKKLGEPVLYFDKNLNLPSYQIADILIQTLKKLGYSGCYFSESLCRKTRIEGDFYDDVISILVFDHKDLKITNREIYKLEFGKFNLTKQI